MLGVSIGISHHVENMGQSQHLLKYERYFTTIGYREILTLMLIIDSGKLTTGGKNEDLLCLYIKKANQSHLC